MNDTIRWRIFSDDDDDVAAITAMLHAAYRPLAEQGWNYVAASQDDAVTRRRLARGYALIGEDDATIVATGTLYFSASTNSPPLYTRPDVAYFGQFAVAPAWQRRGLGTRLLGELEREAVRRGRAFLACDTAAPALHLVRWYEARGFRRVETTRWPHAVYDSAVLLKALG